MGGNKADELVEADNTATTDKSMDNSRQPGIITQIKANTGREHGPKLTARETVKKF